MERYELDQVVQEALDRAEVRLVDDQLEHVAELLFGALQVGKVAPLGREELVEDKGDVRALLDE